VLYSFYIVNKGFEGHSQPHFMGSGAAPQKILVLDPMLGWADPPMVLCMIFAHGFGRDGFLSMVLDAMVFGPWYWTRWILVHGIGCFGMYKYVL